MESRPVSAMGRAIERLKMKKNTKENKPHKCSICGKTFVSKQGLNGHIQRLKKKQMAAAVQFKIIDHYHYKCSICGKSFVSEQSLNGHFKVVHEDLKLNKCNVCEKHFSTEYQLNGHIATVHESIQPYKCLKCDASFLKLQGLKKHITAVHEGKNLNIAVIHEGIEPYTCLNFHKDNCYCAYFSFKT